MSRQKALAHFLLEEIARRPNPPDSVTLWEAAETVVKQSISIGKLYAALGNLEAADCIESFRGDPSPERGNRPRCYWRLRAEGCKLLADVAALGSWVEGKRRFDVARSARDDSGTSNEGDQPMNFPLDPGGELKASIPALGPGNCVVCGAYMSAPYTITVTLNDDAERGDPARVFRYPHCFSHRGTRAKQAAMRKVLAILEGEDHPEVKDR